MQLRANRTGGAVVATGLAIVASEVDHLKVKLFPGDLWKEPLKILFCLHDRLSRGETPAFGEAVDVRIDGKCEFVKGLDEHHRGCLMANTWQFFQGL